MLTMARLCKWLGNGWIALAAVFILLNYAAIWYLDGWSKLQEIASPFNLWNFAAVVITFAPGFGLLKLSEYFARRARDPR